MSSHKEWCTQSTRCIAVAPCPDATTPRSCADTNRGRVAAAAASFRSPVDHAKHQRRVAQQISVALAPAEARERRQIEQTEDLERYQIRTFKHRAGIYGAERIEQEEQAARYAAMFAERTERRRLLASSGSEDAEVANPSSSHVNSPTQRGPTAADSKPLTQRRRTLGASQVVSDVQRAFLAQVDALEAEQATRRGCLDDLQEAARHRLSKYLFYDGYYEYEAHLFDNVPSVEAGERQRRDRCMILLDEFRCRRSIVEDWLDRHRSMCEVLSPFIPTSLRHMEWRSLLQRYFVNHFEYLDGPWGLEERYERHILEQRLKVETTRVLARVAAYIVLCEPANRSRIVAERRYHRATLVAHQHPAVLELHKSHQRWLLRRCFRKLVGLRAFRQASVHLTERVTVMASLATEAVRHRYFAVWRRKCLVARRSGTVATMARQAWVSLGSRYLLAWSRLSSRRLQLQLQCEKLLRRTSVHVKAIHVRYLTSWRLFALHCRAAKLERINELRYRRRVATQWFWGAWRLKRRRNYRAACLKLERCAQLWRLARTMVTWGPQGYLSLRLSQRQKHAELSDMCRRANERHMTDRWHLWRRYARRCRQIRAIQKLERLNHSYHKINRFTTWLRLTSQRDGIRKVGQLLSSFTTQWIRPRFIAWMAFRGSWKRSAALRLLDKTNAEVRRRVLVNWQHTAHRLHYRRLVQSEGHFELFTRRNAFRYALRRWQDWVRGYRRRSQMVNVALLAKTNTHRHRVRCWRLWSIFLARKPQREWVRSSGARCEKRLAIRYYGTWRRVLQLRDKAAGKQNIAESLLRQNNRILLQSTMRRLRTRCLAYGKLPSLISSNEYRLSRSRLLTWKRFLEFAKSYRVADNLSVINSHRWQLLAWMMWQRTARRLRLHRAVAVLEAQNRSILTRVVWQRSWAPVLHRQVLLRELSTIRWTANAKLMDSVMHVWARYAKGWRKHLLAGTLSRKNTHALRSRFFSMWRQWIDERKVTQVRLLSFVSPQGIARDDSLLCDRRSTAQQQPAGVRYFHTWLSWFRRRVDRTVSFRALCMLRDFWYRRAYWHMWSQKVQRNSFKSDGGASALPSPPQQTEHDSPVVGRRQLLRSLAARGLVQD